MILDPRTLGRLAGCVLVGAAVGVIGTAVHRALPWGLVLALGAVVAAAVFGRAWGGGPGVVATGLGLAVTVGVLAGEGPGGDVLVVPDAIGWTWALGFALTGVAFLFPRSWFGDEQVGRDVGPDA